MPGAEKQESFCENGFLSPLKELKRFITSWPRVGPSRAARTWGRRPCLWLGRGSPRTWTRPRAVGVKMGKHFSFLYGYVEYERGNILYLESQPEKNLLGVVACGLGDDQPEAPLSLCPAKKKLFDDRIPVPTEKNRRSMGKPQIDGFAYLGLPPPGPCQVLDTFCYCGSIG